MTPTTPSRGMNRVEDALDIALVTQVILAERQGRDRGWWDQMHDAYWPDSTVTLSWYNGDGPGFIEGSRQMAARGSVALHHSYAPVVHVRGSRAIAELPLAMQMHSEVDHVAANLIAHTRLNYRLSRRGGRWRITSLDAVYEYTTLDPVVPGQRIEVPAEELAAFRPSYALMAWLNARTGFTISTGQLGDDRPEELAAFYADAWNWINAED
ncbi:MAG: nuclear transport factor 2 family protein [Dermatophilaceae bacterium]